MSMPEIHVYPTEYGSDRAALEQAAEQQRQLRAGTTLTEPVRILLHAGTYRLDAPIRLTQQDFGTVRAPVVWTSFADGDVILSGARQVSTSSAAPGAPASFQLEPGTPVTQVYADGRRLLPARLPNLPAPDDAGGWLYTDEPPSGESSERKRFWCRDQELTRFDSIVGARVRVFARHNFRCDSSVITAYHPETGEIQIATPTTYEIDPGNRFYLEHLAEALDAPDEWFPDEPTGRLEVNVGGDSAGNVSVEIARAQHIFQITGDNRAIKDPGVTNWPYWDDLLRTLDPPGSAPVSHLTISNLTLEGTSGTAIQVESCAALLIDGCTIRNTGHRGITVIGGDSCKIADCDISQTSADGVMLAGGMRRPFGSVVVSSHHVITNCRVHHTGLEEKHVPAIALTGAGNRAEHCEVHNAPRWGIHSRGNDHRIEYNDVHDVCEETSDCGAIYLCDRDWLLHGTSIRYNRVHHLVGYPYNNDSVPTVYGIYLDDWSSGVTVYGNLVHDVPRAGIFVNSGHQNVVSNNLVVAGGLELANFLRWPPELEFERVGTDRHGFQKNRFERNILVGTSGDVAIYALEGLIRSNGESEIGANVFDRNLVWTGGGGLRVSILAGRRQLLRLPGDGEDRTLDWEAWREISGQDAGTLIADPMIDDGWHLAEDSPALTMGFEQLPVEEMGLLSAQLHVGTDSTLARSGP
jgi:hypothetical protein